MEKEKRAGGGGGGEGGGGGSGTRDSGSEKRMRGGVGRWRRIITRPNYLISLVVTLFRRAGAPRVWRGA